MSESVPASTINQSEQNVSEQTETQKNQPRLELIDLINCRLCLQLMTRRGAVLPSEMEGFGKVYNNINGFLKQMAPGSISLEDPSTIPNESNSSNGMEVNNTLPSGNMGENTESGQDEDKTTISL